MQELIRQLLLAIGEDPGREGLQKTPERVDKSLRYLTSGYQVDVDALINDAIFSSDTDEMVIVKDIELYSMCEHHLLPFHGRAHVGYIPKGRIIGLSKIPRIVDAYARRLQVQERLTQQIAQALMKHLRPDGVGVVIEAEHLCMAMRGVEKQSSYTITSAMLGSFRTEEATRKEFLELMKHKRG